MQKLTTFLSKDVLVGWPKIHQMCRTFRDRCFSHVFYLVISENDQTVQKKCCLRVPNRTFGYGLIYLLISEQKWLFLHQLSSDPLKCSGSTNKLLETHVHMPKPRQEPKEHQIWAFRRVFSPWNDHILWLGKGWKLTFCFFYKNLSLLSVLTHLKSCRNGSVLKNTSFKTTKSII